MEKKTIQTDAEIIENFRLGLDQNFQAIFRQFYPRLCYFAGRFVSDKVVADDLAADNFIKAWERRESFTNINQLKSFLYTCTRNACFDWLRQQKKTRLFQNEIQYLDSNSEADITVEIIRAETIAAMHAVLKTLPTQCRKVFTLLYLEGKSLRETAEELQLSVSTVKNQRARGLQLLKKRIYPLVLAILTVVLK